MKKKFCLMLIFVIFSLVISGCASEREEQCSLVVDDFLTKYQELDPSVGTYVKEYVENEQIQFKGIQAMIAERISYEIKSSEELENGCTVIVQISVPDFQAIFDDVVAEYTETDTEEQVLRTFESKLKSPNVSKRNFTVEVYVNDTDNNYQIEMTSELTNALSGGYYEYIDSLVEEMLNG